MIPAFRSLQDSHKEERQNMGQRKSYDSKSSALFFASLGITTHQPLLQALQLPGGCSGPAQRFFDISWHFTCSMYNPFFFKYSVFLKQRCYSLQNITLFIQNKQGLVSHPANGNCVAAGWHLTALSYRRQLLFPLTETGNDMPIMNHHLSVEAEIFPLWLPTWITVRIFLSFIKKHLQTFPPFLF